MINIAKIKFAHLNLLFLQYVTIALILYLTYIDVTYPN